MLAQLEGDRAARVAFAVATSAEWSALERAEWDDLGETFVRVRGTKSRLRERVVPVVTPWQKELLAFVRNHAAGQKPKLFAPWAQTTALHTLHAAAKRAGIDPCGWHDLRRSCAQLLRRAGASFDTLAPVLGHSDSKVTQRVYARLDPEGLLQALRAELRCDTGVPDSAASGVSAASLGQAPRPVR